MRFLFGDIVVDVTQVKLTKNETQLECEPRVFELLVYFCKHPDKAISRDELVTYVWGGRVVSDAAVNRAVSELRKLLEDNPSSPIWIKTVSKVGYRLAVTPTILTQSVAGDAQESGELPHDLSQAIYAAQGKSAISAWLRSKSWLFVIIAAALILVLFIFYNIKKTVLESKNNQFHLLNQYAVTTTKGSAFNPYYHASSATLFFLFRENSTAYAQVYMQKESEAAQIISTDDYYYTDVIYGGNGFVYASRLNNLEQRHCEVVKINLQTKDQSLITDCGEGVITQLAFDQKKNRLIYQSRPSISEPYALYSYLMDTGRKQQLTHPVQVGNNTGDYAFALSPSGRMLAVIEYLGEGVDKIKLLDLNTLQVIVSKAFINNVYGLVWRSEHQILASNADGLFEFDTKTITLTAKEQSDQFGRLSLGGNSRTLLTERGQKTINIFSYSTNDASIKALTSSRGISLMPVFGNNSNIMAFRSNRTGTDKVFIQPESKPAFIAEFNSVIESIGTMAWSDNDEQLVASINNALYLYSLTDKRWTALAKEFTGVHYVTFVDDSIMFSAEVDSQWNIWTLSLHNEQEEISQVTFKGGYSIQGNTNEVFYTKFNISGLYKLDLKSGVESLLIENFPIAGWRHWQLRDNKIYYLADKTYKELNLNSNITQTLHNFDERKPNSCNMAFQHNFFACEQIELSTSNIWHMQLSQ
ncbi:winged helix-turn-helix domain-containing protein [Thalassotalea piscium]|uniref:DNA-binding winged helix-turn-helix (WHTH) protein n=1 Tax=Thalassotalea piscium TaxID=1230533 RepID=A0A7X0NH53_9GAMM|nr:winged helix-turn-helix domain-containing protein [Thalassotalea piscium]MBB6543372.1 DNA-binding winged helix-turn-helix (wHTH) protein [Thalassotalea piscium]